MRPIDWPPDAWLACIPEWAWRNGHPAIPENVRATMHAWATEHNARQFLPEDAGG